MCEPKKGRAAIEALAARFPQLYVAPAEGAREAHRLGSARGIVPDGANLRHFVSNSCDELREVQTPAGPVEVLLLNERADFETFLQIIGHKSQPVPIAESVGAITYRGLADWGAVADARRAYIASGGDDWSSEFARLAKIPGTFRAELIVISAGPYSNIQADETPYSEEEWLRVSREIRLYHECAHVVCRRVLPEDILPVWDEITADMVGLIGATGGYDSALAARFLGVSSSGYAGGRLNEYLDEEQKCQIDRVSIEVHASLERLAGVLADSDISKPFDILIDLKKNPLLDY